MKNRTLFILIGIAVVLSLLLVMQHFFSAMTQEESYVERRVDPNWVKGSALVQGDKPYTLNLDQQLELIRIINNAEAPEKAPSPIKLPASKFVIYRFPKESEITISAQGAVDGKIVFQATGLESHLFIEKSPGSLQKLIEGAL